MIRSNKPEDRPGENSVSRPLGDLPTASSSSPSASTVKSTHSVVDAAPIAVIGPKIQFKGELVGEEDLLIQGHVDGTIDLKGNNLTIGDKGVVKANVLAQTITIEGTIEGDVYGEERISILSSSNVKGNLVADRVTLEDGAKFKGSIDMEIESRKEDFQKFNANSTLARSPSLDVNKPKPKVTEPA